MRSGNTFGRGHRRALRTLRSRATRNRGGGGGDANEPSYSVERARPEDMTAVLGLLQATGLPTGGVERLGRTLVVARDRANIIGCAAVEIYGEEALLRSVAVFGPRRRSGIGRRLTEAACELARDAGADSVYLLTETAERYFPRLGFERVGREELPETVRASEEFRSLCPESAIAMRRVFPQH